MTNIPLSPAMSELLSSYTKHIKIISDQLELIQKLLGDVCSAIVRDAGGEGDGWRIAPDFSALIQEQSKPE